jgi:branched-chain amino acid aminotransferase
MKGQLKYANLHADRVRRGMKILKIEGHSEIDEYFLNEKISELVRKNKIGPNGRARLTVFRNADGLYSPTTNKMGYSLEISKLTEAAYSPNKKGLIVDVFDDLTKSIDLLSNLKTCNSLLYVLAGVFKNQHRLDEALILNDKGFLCEGMSSNVFIVYQSQLYTPALTEGCIAGVMRNVVMRLAKENNIEVIEAEVNPAILNEADEVFVTNASRGIQWVMGYNGKRYFNELSRFLLEKLNQQ